MNIDSKERAKLLELAAANREPFYALFSDRVREDFTRLKGALPSHCRIHYSLKANPDPSLVKFLGSLGAGADVASLGELKTALAAGIPAAQISFTGPAKSEAELSLALESGCGNIAVESVTEMKRLGALARKAGARANVLVRVNPLYYVSAAGRPVEGPSSQFGTDEENLGELFREMKNEEGIEFHGLHVFTQGQILDAAVATANIEGTLALAQKVSAEHGVDVRAVDIGLGFGVAYFSGQAALDLEPVKRFFQSRRDLPKELIAESGRYLTARAGFYVTRVVDRKVSRGKTFLIVNGGLNHHLAAAGFGQAVRRNFPVTLLEREKGPAAKVTIAGPTCYSLDVLAMDAEIPEARIGDHIVICNSGAYGANFSPAGFLSRPPALQFLL